MAASKRVLITETKPATPVNYQKSYSLKILSATKEDSGVYEIVAINKLGEVRCSSELTIEFAPVITKDLKPKEKATEDSAFKYEVSAKGCPKPQVKWYHEDTEVSASGDEFATHNENEVYSLTVKRVRSSSAGRYKAVARNDLGTASSIVSELDVDLKPVIKPLFETVEAGQHVLVESEGSSVALEFKVEGRPDPVVTLYKDDVLVKSSEKRVALVKKAEVNKSS